MKKRDFSCHFPRKNVESLGNKEFPCYAYKDITFGIKFGDCNVGCSDGIDSFPWFCAFLLKRYLSTVEVVS
jgi:hypothetical protein